MKKVGFVSIVGKTNAGKSTLLNLIMKQKISIATSKPQTTRNSIQGIIVMMIHKLFLLTHQV